jgi:hypothetical protein
MKWDNPEAKEWSKRSKFPWKWGVEGYDDVEGSGGYFFFSFWREYPGVLPFTLSIPSIPSTLLKNKHITFLIERERGWHRQ